ncbi:IPT/TIG domain-containing protein [Schnuerera sp. xch1]|uniref:IPT/TIG domain-containing protein n=1 Tax=Schnuerera sp. xch1 TaxID=2874283 RepID=UPI001CBDCDEB|nr:IPT/TIG domain-containing protein [Schnuerera sp. xch1]MBZ2175119.1 IPT/TIG domain-containing protein [Schnuerera sp. xch1]
MLGRRIRFRRITSYILLFCILLSEMIFNIPVSYSEDVAEPAAKVTITNTYTNFNRTKKMITIEDPGIELYVNKGLQLQLEDDNWHTPDNLKVVGQTIVQSDLNPRWVIQNAIVEGQISEGEPPQYRDVSTKYSGINEAGVPEIMNVATPLVEQGGEIILNMSGSLDGFSNYEITVGGIPVQAEVQGTNQIRLKPDEDKEFSGGINDIVVKADVDNEKFDLQTSYVYKDAVTITGDLNISGVTMFPTMGEPGSRVEFTMDEFPSSEYDIYFIKDRNVPEFTEENMAKNFFMSRNSNDDDIITVEVPDLSSGPYYVIFTNAQSQDPDIGVCSSYELPQQYQVVTISQKPRIESIQPSSAPASTSTEVRINGNYFVNHNVPGFEPEEGLIDEDIIVTSNQVVIDYGEGTLELKDEAGNPITHDVKVTREIEVDIGDVLKFKEDGFLYNLENENDPNTFIVSTKTFDVDETQIEDVVVRVTTRIEGINNSEFNANMLKEAVVKNGFTYYPSTEIPEVDSVVPNIVPVEDIGNEYYIDSSIDRLMLTIEGSNFLVTRYEDGEEEKINYPEITLGGTVINPNAEEGDGKYKPLKYEVLNNGQIVDGTTGNEIGNRIIIELITGEDGFPITNKESRILSVRNPLRLSKEYSNSNYHFEDLVKFIEIDRNDFPIIDNVRPSLVSIDGGEEVTITGSNLRPGARVYIDNNLVTNIHISGDMKQITFNAPPGTRVGETLLQVINPEGGIASHVFTYTETYTEPELSFINPKEGTTNTLVTVKGENFLAPDPTVVINDIEQVDEHLIYRLIGTRVFMDGYDINQYNRGEQNRIELKNYGKGPIFKYSNATKVILGDGYDSVILYDETNNKFYVIRKDVRDNFSIEAGEGISYDISYNPENDKFYADNHEITINDNGEIGFDNLTLQAYTPFKIDENENIVGNRVQFVDSNTLTFKVPNLNLSPWTGEGVYDVSIVNPDTKSETIEDGFYFFASSSTRPVIEDIVPDSGPDVGGNIIRILGPEANSDERIGFMDTGEDKTKVFIGGQEVPTEDVNVLPGGRIMEVKVPPTIEDIKGKGTDRITVPIVLVNPDGGTYSVSYENPVEVEDRIIRGYTYLVPTSNPKITSILPTEGSAAGGYILEIFGSDFRDFEPFIDLDGDGEYDEENEEFDDIDGDGEYDDKAPDTREQSKYNPEYEYLTSILLPKVYIGYKEAEIVNHGTGYLQVVVPPNEAGTVDLYVVNNDSGISNKVRYTYNASNPTINNIVPSVGDISGGTKIGIYGSNLENNTITLVEANDTGEIVKKTEHMPLIRFGSNTNQNLPREHENSGVLRSNRASVDLEGSIEIQYNTINRRLIATLEDDDIKYTFTYEGYDGEEIFINTKDFKHGDENYVYEQLIRIVVDTNRLIASANFAPVSEYKNNTQITAITPVYFRAGLTPVFVINPDNGQAEWEFEFKHPDSNPKITNITKNGGDKPILEYREEIDGEVEVLKVDYQGGNIVTIHGTDFREGAIIKIEDLLTITEKDIEYNLPNQLTFVMPPVPEGEAESLKKVVVENTDGGTADSTTNTPPIYIEFIIGGSNPEVYTIEPTEGLATGGTKVKIIGNDFRKEMEEFPNGELKVYFGDVKVEDIDYIDYRTIEVTAPKSDRLGPVQIRIENPDGSITRDEIYFTYISKPKIKTVSPNKIFTNDIETEVTLTGDMFMQGAKVIVGGRIVDINDIEDDMNIKGEGILEVDEEGNNRQVAVVGGMEAASVTVEDDNVIKVRFNKATDLENNDLIIINLDGGISDPYDDFDYEIPVPNKPLVLEGIPGYESTVQLIWSKSDDDVLNKATRYEIYGRLSKDKDYTFIGDTTEAEFLVKGLEPNTEYRFMVRALNEYGSALEFATVKVKTLTIREDDKLKEKEQKLDEEQEKIEREGKEEIISGRVIQTIGSKTIRKGVVDFRLSQYKNYDKLTVSVPIEYARESNKLVIRDGTMTTMINVKDLYTLEVSKNDTGDQDAYINIHIDRLNEYHIPRGKKLASKAYNISFDYQHKKETMEINNLVRPARLTLEQDKLSYPNTVNTRLYKFNEPTGQYTRIDSDWTDVKTSGKYILLADR